MDSAKAIFSKAVIVSSRLNSWKIKPSSSLRKSFKASPRRFVMFFPSSKIFPVLTTSIVETQLRSVVFPLPLAPMMQVPVGKATILTMRPVTFSEFLRTADERTWKYMDELDEIGHLPEITMSKLELEYRRYLVCGGMPEAATALLENRGTAQVDKVLQDILDLYELDFAKYAEPREIPRIHAVWNSLPSQLAKENRKFLYNVVKPGARARDYEDALLWLGRGDFGFRDGLDGGGGWFARMQDLVDSFLDGGLLINEPEPDE